MFYIHGGGNVEGTGTAPLFDGGNLVEDDVVVVAIQYRLGALGFLAHPDLTAEDPFQTGNAGFLDQQAALQWVQAHIEDFGGDPGNVTVFGLSAGSQDTALHRHAPDSWDLFDKTIQQSGAASTRTLEAAYAQGESIASWLGCDAANDVVACLRGIPVNALLYAPAAGWGPVWDGLVFPEDPHSTLIPGSPTFGFFHRGPALGGTTADEGRNWMWWQDAGDVFTTGAHRVMTREDFDAFLANFVGPDFPPGSAEATMKITRERRRIEADDWLPFEEPRVLVAYMAIVFVIWVRNIVWRTV